MEKLLTIREKADDTLRAKAIKAIKHRKASSAKYRRIKQTLGREKSNKLTKLEVPADDGGCKVKT